MPAHERETFRTMGRTLLQALHVIRRRRVLILIVMTPFLFGASSESARSADHAIPVADDHNATARTARPVAWFGLSSYVSMGLGFGLLEVVRRTVNTSNDHAVAGSLMALQALYVGSLVAFGLATEFAFAIAMFWARGPLRRASGPLLSAWQNRFVPSQVRATVLSFGGQMDAVRPDDRRTPPRRSRARIVTARRIPCSRNCVAPSLDRLRCAGKASQVSHSVRLKADLH